MFCGWIMRIQYQIVFVTFFDFGMLIFLIKKTYRSDSNDSDITMDSFIDRWRCFRCTKEKTDLY